MESLPVFADRKRMMVVVETYCPNDIQLMKSKAYC